MSNRYWVGGTDNWNGTAGTKWSTTSGGGGGSAVPTSSDDVFFDANSGTGTVTVSATGNCSNLVFTGFAGTFAGSSNVQIYGNLTFGSGMTLSHTGQLNMNGTGTVDITTNNNTILGITSLGSSGTYNLQDDFLSTGAFVIFGSSLTFNTNNYNLTCKSFSCSGSFTRTINLGSGIITLTGTTGISIWNTSVTTGMTFDCGTSTIKTTGAYSASNSFSGGGLTFYDLRCEHTSTSFSLLMTGSNTFNSIYIGSNARLRPSSGLTQTVSSFTSGGTAGNESQFLSNGGTTTISKSSGTVNVNSISLTDTIATGGATWNAIDSIDNGGNSGWNFSSTQNNSSFLSLLI